MGWSYLENSESDEFGLGRVAAAAVVDPFKGLGRNMLVRALEPSTVRTDPVVNSLSQRYSAELTMFSMVATLPLTVLFEEDDDDDVDPLDCDDCVDQESVEDELLVIRPLDSTKRSDPSEKVGATALTRTLSLDHSLDNPAVILSNPALLAA